MIAFAIVFALVLNRLKAKQTQNTDTIISVCSSLSVALGLAILSQGGNFSKYSGLLVGDILSISGKELGYLLLIFVVTLVFWLAAFNRLNAVSINRSVASSRGIPVALMDSAVRHPDGVHRHAFYRMGGAHDHQRPADPAGGIGP